MGNVCVRENACACVCACTGYLYPHFAITGKMAVAKIPKFVCVSFIYFAVYYHIISFIKVTLCIYVMGSEKRGHFTNTFKLHFLPSLERYIIVDRYGAKSVGISYSVQEICSIY